MTSPEEARQVAQDLINAPGALEARRRMDLKELERLDAQITDCKRCSAQTFGNFCKWCEARLTRTA